MLLLINFISSIKSLLLITTIIIANSQRQPEIHLFAARFKEQSGDIAGARESYQLVHTEISPGLLEAVIKHANMEYRLVKSLKTLQ